MKITFYPPSRILQLLWAKEQLNDAKFAEYKSLKTSQVNLPQKHFFKMVLTTALMKELTKDLLSNMKLCYSHNTFLSVIKIYNTHVLI